MEAELSENESNLNDKPGSGSKRKKSTIDDEKEEGSSSSKLFRKARGT